MPESRTDTPPRCLCEGHRCREGGQFGSGSDPPPPSQQWSCSRSCLQHLIWGEKHCIHTRLSYRLFITLLPKKQRPSLAAEPGGSHCFHYCVVVVTVSGNFHWKEIVMVQPSLLRFQWTFSQKIASLPTSESQTGSSIYWWWLFNYVVYSKKKKKKKKKKVTL